MVKIFYSKENIVTDDGITLKVWYLFGIPVFQKVQKEFDVERYSEECERELNEKLKVIYKTDGYKNQKKYYFDCYNEFKEEHKDKIGKIYNSDFGTYKILKVKEPWFLKSPILIDDANFKWKFEESFLVEPFDNQEFYEVTLEDLDYAEEITRDDLIKNVNEFASPRKEVKG